MVFLFHAICREKEKKQGRREIERELNKRSIIVLCVKIIVPPSILLFGKVFYVNGEIICE